MAQTVKNLPDNAGDLGTIPGSEDLLEKGMATHSSVLAWRILWTEEPGGLQSTGSQRVRHDSTSKHIHFSCSVRASHCCGFSCCRPQALGSWASVAAAPRLQSTVSIVVAQRLSCSTTCGIFLDQGSNPCLLHWQVDSLPLSHQGSPSWGLFISKTHMTSDRKGRRYIFDFFLTVENQAVKAVLGQENTSLWPDDRALMLVNPGRSFGNRG